MRYLWNLGKSHLNISLSFRVPSDSHKPHDLPQHKTEQLIREFVSFRCSKLVTRKQSDIILQCVAHRNLIHTCVNLMIIPIKIPLQIKMEQREKWRKNSSPQCWLRFDYYFTNVIIASYHVQNNNQPSKYQLVVVSAQILPNSGLALYIAFLFKFAATEWKLVFSTHRHRF